ncbi:hypothetical protein NLX83_37455 [Allokutzneria sp. A3M-2-11 16]|uniref:hypothetical protein n=1 Tax=Allokutzneria sp. A3M-2-11 16 TaxID=2962043 RepID=UPI0020B86A35|nr:hypothetical protein [Allokutzneria sp. A3M-2-11 16]MCP3804969.1 hypothetical protein [Allokutzneria sp. A3M-2-11 16]
MRTIRLVAVAAALALAGTACGGGGGGSTTPAGPGGNDGATAPETTKKPQTFADLPGEALTFQGSSRRGVNKAKVSVKVLKTEWTDDYTGHIKPAPAGSTFLKVYFAVASADPAVEVEDFGPRDLNARWATSQAPSVQCPTGAYNPIFVTGYCHVETEMGTTNLAPLAGDWAKEVFHSSHSVDAQIKPNTAYVTLGLYKIPDAVKGDLSVCASGMHKTGSEQGTPWPCQKLQLPPRP